MKTSFSLAVGLWIAITPLQADEFRYHYSDGTTGLTEGVYSRDGKSSTIRFTKDSDPLHSRSRRRFSISPCSAPRKRSGIEV